MTFHLDLKAIWRIIGKKFEYRISNIETISKFKFSNDQKQKKNMTERAINIKILSFDIRICFGFRYSDFGFPRLAIVVDYKHPFNTAVFIE